MVEVEVEQSEWVPLQGLQVKRHRWGLLMEYNYNSKHTMEREIKVEEVWGIKAGYGKFGKAICMRKWTH